MNEKVKRFAQQMDIELDNNAAKGGIFFWRGTRQKISELEYHKAKLLMAMKLKDKKAIKEYIADCANILMAIGDEYNLYDYEPINNGTQSVIKVNVIQEESVSRFNEPFLT